MLSVLLQERALCYNYRVLLWKNSDFKGKAMLELLSPAGSPEAVIAAVQNGADAVYMGLDGFNARRGAKNFSVTEFAKAVRYCHIRGCKVYVTLNTLVSDKEMEELVELARLASDTGADAILVQDLGVAAVLREAVPDIPLHASTQMSIHNLAGALAAQQMGMTRVVLARELSLEQIRFICSNTTVGLTWYSCTYWNLHFIRNSHFFKLSLL